MSHTKFLLALLPIGLFVSSARAESIRPLFSLENAFPRWEQFEVGVSYQAIERENGFIQDDRQTYSAYVRYGILDNFAVKLEVPYVNLDASPAGSESGIGDLAVEFQLRTWEDIFGYPYFIPYLRATIPTGDEDKGLGSEDSVVTAGLAYGDNISDELQWVLDFGYRVNPDEDNQFILANSYIYNVSDEFALLVEILYEEEIESDEESLVVLSGGFSYYWTQHLRMGAHLGGGITGDVDIWSQFSLNYSF